MPADFSNLQSAIKALTDQVTAQTTLESSAAALLKGQADAITQAVTAALQADDAADQGSIDAATAAITQANSGFVASAGVLGDAMSANTPPPPPPPAA